MTDRKRFVAYVRWSHAEQSDRLSRQAQEHQYREYHARHFPTVPLVEPFFCDEATSAYKRPFLSRPGARALMDALRPGDGIITRLDRAFRNWRQSAQLIDKWKSMDVIPYFVDIPLPPADGTRLSQLMHELVLWLMSWCAEIESARTSERIKAAQEALRAKMRANGLPENLAPTNHPPLGKKWEGPSGRKYLVDDPEKRAIMRYVLQARQQRKLSFRQIAIDLDEHIRRERGLPKRKPGEKLMYSHVSVRNMFRQEQEYIRLGI
jgi:DNA invertase Pin-like site-specific DNA recombinase